MNVHISSSDPIVGQHIKHYREQLLTFAEINLSSFDSSYLRLQPLIHSLAASDKFDSDGFNYSSSRLPKSIACVQRILISSNPDVDPTIFNIQTATPVNSPNRRRFSYLDDTGTLFVLINSYSDIDDLINNLTCFRLEYQKIKKQQLLNYPEILNCEKSDFNPTIKLLPLSESGFPDNASLWWKKNIDHSLYFQLTSQPVYFISSNTHSLINIVTGFLNQKQSYIFDYLAKKHTRIYDKWFESKVEHDQAQISDFLNYLSENFLQDNQQFLDDKKNYEHKLGIITIPASKYFPIDMQIIPLKALALSAYPDPNLNPDLLKSLANSNGVIINIQYPLGVAAKYLFDAFIDLFSDIRGAYIIGKAAILNGTVGDIQIPNVVFDEVTNNIYQFDNVFNQFFPFKGVISQILTNQKAVCVHGTLLENKSQIENYKKSDFNIIEMESGHYLSSIVEKIVTKQPLSQSSVYQLNNLPLDFGIINYASDNPLTENLSKESIEFRGIETTYLSSINVLSRIIELEKK